MLASGELELYDEVHDPGETRNLAKDPGHANVIAELAQDSAITCGRSATRPGEARFQACRARRKAVADNDSSSLDSVAEIVMTVSAWSQQGFPNHAERPLLYFLTSTLSRTQWRKVNSPSTREKQPMCYHGRSLLRVLIGTTFWAALMALAGQAASAIELVLSDGRVLRGKEGQTASLADLQSPESGPLRLIVFLDDDLRRTFVPKQRMREVRHEEASRLEEKFLLRQRVASIGATVKSVGPVIGIQPFDEFGRRIFTLNTVRGPVDIIQGHHRDHAAVVEGRRAFRTCGTCGSPPARFRRDVLQKILLKQIDPKNIEHLQEARPLLPASRALRGCPQQLEAILQAFPDKPNLKSELEPSIRELRQDGGPAVVGRAEAAARARASTNWCSDMLKKFPSEDVAGEVLQAVREMIDEYEALRARRDEVLQAVRRPAEARRRHGPARARIEPIRERDRRRAGLRHAGAHGGLHAERRRRGHDARRKAGPGHQRLAAGLRCGGRQAARRRSRPTSVASWCGSISSSR